MKKILLIICIVLSLTGCVNKQENTSKLENMIMVDKELYISTHETIPMPTCGTGINEVSSIIDSSQVPYKDGQINFESENKETILYQRYDENNISVIIGEECVLFKKENSEDYGVSDLPLGIKVSVVNLDSGILTLNVDNQSGYEMSFDKYGQLQRLDDDWTNIDMIDGAIIEESVYTLKDLENIEISYDLNNLYGNLNKGTYRLLWEDTEVRFEVK